MFRGLNSQQKKVGLVAFVVFGLLASSFLIYRCWTYIQRKPLQNEIQIRQPISLLAAHMTQRYPQLVMGSHQLFQWDAANQRIILSRPFQSLLCLLVELGTLESTKIDSLEDLNAQLQKPQGQGGLLRKPELERWHITDHLLWRQKRPELERLLVQLGLMRPQTLPHPVSVKHCLIFGAWAERVEARIRATLDLLLSNQLQTERVFLLGSKRKLVPEERLFLENKINHLANEEQKKYWQAIFAQEDQAIEANACLFLWESLVPAHVQKALKVIAIQSTQIGFSYREKEGNRTTCEVTAEDWTSYYTDQEPQTIFALAELPYVRLVDQLRTSVLTDAKRATVDLMNHRIANTTFYFAHPQPKQEPLIGVILDEIARNVYRTVDLLRYLDKLQAQ
jgi:hypothetical protein